MWVSAVTMLELDGSDAPTSALLLIGSSDVLQAAEARYTVTLRHVQNRHKPHAPMGSFGDPKLVPSENSLARSAVAATRILVRF